MADFKFYEIIIPALDNLPVRLGTGALAVLCILPPDSFLCSRIEFEIVRLPASDSYSEDSCGTSKVRNPILANPHEPCILFARLLSSLQTQGLLSDSVRQNRRKAWTSQMADDKYTRPCGARLVFFFFSFSSSSFSCYSSALLRLLFLLVSTL